MRITLEIPEEIARALVSAGENPARAALEAIGLEAYRRRRISGYQLRTLLGLTSRYELDGFLKQHQVEKYTVADLENDLATIRQIDDDLRAKRRA